MKLVTKSLIILAVILLAVCVFNTNTVKAANAHGAEGKLVVGDTVIMDNYILTSDTVTGAIYNKDTNTLTLNNYNGGSIYIASLKENFKIEVIGVNTINADVMGYSIRGDLAFDEGVEEDYITFTGTGTLNAKGGINTMGTITINGPKINITSDDTALFSFSLNINNGTVSAKTNGIEEYCRAIDTRNFKCSDKITYTDNNGNKVYLVNYDEYYKTFCTTETYSVDTVARNLVIKQATTIADKDTNIEIKLDTTTANVPEGTKLIVNKITTGNTYNVVSNTLGNSVSSFVVYDITLDSNGVEIQPNGKVKISIPITNDFDTSNLAVYRIADDGTKTKYDVTITTIDGVKYVTFETDHFSTYVLTDTTQTNNNNNNNSNNSNNDTTTNKGEKDNTPKTGTIDMIYYLIPMTAIAIIGIVAFRKKQTK